MPEHNQQQYLTSLFALNGKNCLITGAASGLGRHCATVLAKAGANVVLIDKNAEGLTETAKRLSVYDTTVITQCIDLRDRNGIVDGLANVARKLQPFDVLVNCAGIAIFKPALEQTEDEWDEVFGVNIKGMWMMSDQTARYMIKEKVKGNIINISSAVSYRPQDSLTPYGASKASVNHFTKSFAHDMMPYGIRVNTLAPGGMLTEMVEDFLKTKGGRDAVWSVPMKRFANLDELDGALLFLASNNASSYMTGGIVQVDGGLCTSLLPAPD